MAINPANITTIRVGELVPSEPTLTDKIAIEQGTDLFRCTVQELADLLTLNTGALQYEIKTLNVNQTYIDTNFDSSGLGRLLCQGFAICNGNNGTVNIDGLVSVAYGSNYNVVGGFGGSKDAVVVSHSHTVGALGDVSNNKELRFGTNADIETRFETLTTSTVGVSGINKNMQPYIVQLKIMKL